MFALDVSENNGIINMDNFRKNGVDGVIIRAGYGKNHIDEQFKNNIYSAVRNKLKIGAYWYSYALSMEDAQKEGEYLRKAIEDTGVLCELPMFIDFEDTDDYKKSNGYDITIPSNIFRNTNICEQFIRATHLNCGVYGSLFTFNNIDWESLAKKYNSPLWVAQWNSKCDLPAFGWQFTDGFVIDGQKFDGSVFRC